MSLDPQSVINTLAERKISITDLVQEQLSHLKTISADSVHAHSHRTVSDHIKQLLNKQSGPIIQKLQETYKQMSPSKQVKLVSSILSRQSNEDSDVFDELRKAL